MCGSYVPEEGVVHDFTKCILKIDHPTYNYSVFITFKFISHEGDPNALSRHKRIWHILKGNNIEQWSTMGKTSANILNKNNVRFWLAYRRGDPADSTEPSLIACTKYGYIDGLRQTFRSLVKLVGVLTISLLAATFVTDNICKRFDFDDFLKKILSKKSHHT